MQLNKDFEFPTYTRIKKAELDELLAIRRREDEILKKHPGWEWVQLIKDMNTYQAEKRAKA